MINCASDLGATTEAACEVFSAGRGAVYDYLRLNAASPAQVPFYYLNLVRTGNADDRAARSIRPTEEQIEIAYAAVFHESPLVCEVAELLDGCRQKPLVAQLLGSVNFIERLPRLLAAAFPEASRLWHVHVPKTAGTSFFRAAMNCGWGFINLNRLPGAVGNVLEVANSLRIGPESRSRIIISGHWHLWRRMTEIDPGDRVITFVRDPLESMVSEFNFAVDVVNRSSNVHSAHPSVMLDRGLDPHSFVNSYRQGFFVPNVQCSYLAEDAQCKTALANLSRFNTELLPAEATDYAMRKHFATTEQQRANVSNKHIQLADLSRELREELLTRSSQDFLLSEIAKQRFREAA